jgi:hypothetical protein
VLTAPAIMEALERVMSGEVGIRAGDETSAGGRVTGRVAPRGFSSRRCC